MIGDRYLGKPRKDLPPFQQDESGFGTRGRSHLPGQFNDDLAQFNTNAQQLLEFPVAPAPLQNSWRKRL